MYSAQWKRGKALAHGDILFKPIRSATVSVSASAGSLADPVHRTKELALRSLPMTEFCHGLPSNPSSPPTPLGPLRAGGGSSLPMEAVSVRFLSKKSCMKMASNASAAKKWRFLARASTRA